MAFTKREKAAVKALVSCHETGKPVGNYSSLVVLSDGAGITYGSHQATHGSGSLYKIVKLYCDISQSDISKALYPYLAGLKTTTKKVAYSKDTTLKNLLKKAGSDPQMQYAQNKTFEVNYFEPAVQAVQGSGWVTPLALAVVYDSMIQGGWQTLRDRVTATGEKAWVKAYVALRRHWLESSKKSVVRSSVYRMKTFETLIANGNWSLDTPFVVHGATVKDSDLEAWIESDESSDPVVPVTPVQPDPVEDTSEDNSTPEDTDTPDDSATPEDTDSDGQDSNDSDDTESEDSGVDDTKPAPLIGETVTVKAGADAPRQSGLGTWWTTVTATATSLGVSVAGAASWFWGAITDPKSANFVMAIAILGAVIGAIYGLFYLITRYKTRSVQAQQQHEILLKQMELASRQDRYNVKVVR